MTKTITDNQMLGEEGVNLVQKRVMEMRYTWHPSNQPVEAGLDGFVELRDSVTGEVKNSWIGVQSKATNNLDKVDGCPTFACKQKDLDYWLAGSMPVVLILSKPADDVAYWVSVKDYFQKNDPSKNRTIHFHPTDDLLTASSADDWKALSSQYGAGTYFQPPAIQEALSSNLIRISLKAQHIFVAETELNDYKSFREKLRETDPYPPWEWTLGNDGKAYSFHDLSGKPWVEAIKWGTVHRVDAEEFSRTETHQARSVFVRLLKACVQATFKGWRLRWSKESECHYFAANREGIERKLHYRSRSKSTSRDVVKKYVDKKDPDRVMSYRHNAFEHRVLRLSLIHI